MPSRIPMLPPIPIHHLPPSRLVAAPKLRATLRPDHGVKHSLFSIPSHGQVEALPFQRSNLGPVLPRQTPPRKPPLDQLSSKFHGWIENRHWVPNAISLIPPRPLGCRRSDGHHALTNPISRALPTSSPRPIPSHPIRLTRPLPHPRRASPSGFRAYTFLRSK